MDNIDSLRKEVGHPGILNIDDPGKFSPETIRAATFATKRLDGRWHKKISPLNLRA
jgi:hypothetical protein